MKKLKSPFKGRTFSPKGLLEVVKCIAEFIFIGAVLVGSGYLVANYPVEFFGTIMGGVLLVSAALIVWGIFDQVFPKKKDNVEEWFNTPYEENKQNESN